MRRELGWVVAVFAGAAPLRAQDAKPGDVRAENVTIQLLPGKETPPPPPSPGYTGRFSSKDLRALLDEHQNRLPISMQSKEQKLMLLDAIDRINMEAVVDALTDYFKANFKGRFDPKHDLVVAPVPSDKQIKLDAPKLKDKTYTGPATEITGFMVHNLSEAEFIAIAVRVLQTSRQLLDSGDPLYDRSAKDYYKSVAEFDVKRLSKATEDAAKIEEKRKNARKRIGEALGIYDAAGDKVIEGREAAWGKESRRFSFIVKDGKFVERLKPIVEDVNMEMEMAGFAPPGPLDRPGVYYDPDIKNVDVVMPKSMVAEFLAILDDVERRMAEDFIISIEAVRLTDRDITTGALASRLTGGFQGVTDVSRFRSSNVIRELGLNSLLAVANQQLQVSTLGNVAAGTFPDGVAPITIASPRLPPPRFEPAPTLVGGNLRVGAEDIFFDGRQESYGFSYVSPDGQVHTLGFDVVDSLRQLWDRIERNLIVHKIMKVEKLTKFTVPVGPQTKTYDGIAAIISQEDQQLIVATGTGAISQISATAGTWLVIENFEITPTPGSSTALTDDERSEVEGRVLLTMLLRDPYFSTDSKRTLLGIKDRVALREALEAEYQKVADAMVKTVSDGRTYRTIYDRRRNETMEDATVEKKERNSTITLNFFSSQGNIVQTPGSTQLGSANDLTSFTTLLKPNKVTPISSFMTKSSSSAESESAITGQAKGERTDQAKSMTHLVIRARFPTSEREELDLIEGRHLGYFSLPMSKEGISKVEIPMLSSSEHPLTRLSKLRVGLMFETLQSDRIKDYSVFVNPNKFPGSVPREVFNAAMTRFLMNQKIIADSPNRDAAIAADYVQQFTVSVRSLIEYDKDFFDAPNLALQNLAQWNDPIAIALALNNSPNRFALDRLIEMLDALGAQLVPDEYVEKYLAHAEPSFLGPTRLFPLSFEEIRVIRRDAAAHLLRAKQAYGDAFLEAISDILALGSYRLERPDLVKGAALEGRQRLVVFNLGGENASQPEIVEQAHGDFMLLKSGGFKGKLFEPSFLGLEDMAKDRRALVIYGKEALAYENDWKVYSY
ncbi:MAG: hypothetical protein ACKVS9_16110 [Phycisphaerae bacterium]